MRDFTSCSSLPLTHHHLSTICSSFILSGFLRQSRIEDRCLDLVPEAETPDKPISPSFSITKPRQHPSAATFSHQPRFPQPTHRCSKTTSPFPHANLASFVIKTIISADTRPLIRPTNSSLIRAVHELPVTPSCQVFRNHGSLRLHQQHQLHLQLRNRLVSTL
jgi:hypothetical protein